jgi:starch synthase
MDILFATTELAPYVKVGGLGDVSAALPKHLRLLGHNVTVVLPKFAAFERSGLMLARRLTPILVPLWGREWEVTVYDGRLPSQVELCLLDVEGLYDREEVYGPHGGASPFVDNDVRFAVFSRAVLELVRQRAELQRPFDVLHANDWPSALACAYLRAAALDNSALFPTRSVLTIHNGAHEGIFLERTPTSLDLQRVVGDGDAHRAVGFLELGVRAADAVTTVSEHYARSLVESDAVSPLNDALRAATRPLLGIVNGVDASIWNPSTDTYLAARFDAEDPSPKARCKGALQRELDLPLEADAPLLVSVGRLAEQKGVDLVAAAMGRILRGSDAQLVVAGEGDEGLERALREAAQRSHGRARFVGHAGEALVHRLMAAADFVLAPSRFEPCGLVHMYGQRYGALPIARATGGIVDTVVDCDAKLETGTGFLFGDATADELVAAAERAVAARHHARWPTLVRRVMRLDRGWERPARRYDQLFRSLVGVTPQAA